MLQTSITNIAPPGTAGMIASHTSWDAYQAIPGLVNKTIAVLPFGRFCRAIVATGGVELPSATGQLMAGVIIENLTGFLTLTNTALGVQPGAFVDIMAKGDIWVTCETSGAKPGDPVFVRHTANGGLVDLGGISNVAGTGLDALPQARFVSGVTNGIAVIRINLP